MKNVPPEPKPVGPSVETPPRKGILGNIFRRESADRVWSFVQRGALLATIVYAVLTYFMWKDSHRNFTIDERAWLHAGTNLPNAVQEGTQLQSNLLVFNTGKTVALRVFLECTVSRQVSGDIVAFDYTGKHAVSDMGMITPNSVTNVQCASGELDQLDTLSKSRADDLNSGRAYLAVYGRGRYDDVFGGTHWFQFCAWKSYYAGPGNYNARSCTDYNDTGDGIPSNWLKDK